MIVNKNALMLRDNEGNLLPMEMESEVFKGALKIIPLTEGDFNEIRTNAGNIKDEDFISKYLVEPKLTKDEITTLPIISKREISKLILMTAGLSREEVEKGMKIALDNLDTNKKKS